MRGAVLHAPGDIRVDQRPDPTIEQPPTRVIRLSATCVCGSDLWPYRGIEKVDGPAPMGHEYVGIVEEVGATSATSSRASSSSARSSPPTTPARSAGPDTRPPACTASRWARYGAQAQYTCGFRSPDGTLVATPGRFPPRT
jgi:threonine dehydrogenase-like Zn-dependent dehydrogenase